MHTYSRSSYNPKPSMAMKGSTQLHSTLTLRLKLLYKLIKSNCYIKIMRNFTIQHAIIKNYIRAQSTEYSDPKTLDI